MDTEDYNHMVPQKDLDTAVILGGAVTAKCGERFEPSLRVGSGGRTDELGWDTCPDCQDIADLEERWRKLRDDRDRLEREMAEQREAIAGRRRQLRLERTFAQPSIVI